MLLSPATQPTAFEWFAQIWIPAAGAILTLVVAIATLVIAVRANQTAEATALQLAEKEARDDRASFAEQLHSWSRTGKTPYAEKIRMELLAQSTGQDAIKLVTWWVNAVRDVARVHARVRPKKLKKERSAQLLFGCSNALGMELAEWVRTGAVSTDVLEHPLVTPIEAGPLPPSHQ